MPGGYKNIKPDDGKKFSSDYQPENNGRKPSIRNQLKKLAHADGKLTFGPKDCEIHKDGSVTIKIAREELIALKLWEWAISEKGNISLKAIQMIFDQIDGKPIPQTENEKTVPFIYTPIQTYPEDDISDQIE